MNQQIIGNPENEAQFLKLVQQYGEKKWVEVARQLNIICGIRISNSNKLRGIYDTILLNKAVITDAQVSQALVLFIKHKGSIGDAYAEFCKDGKTLIKTAVAQPIRNKAGRALRHLVLLLSRKKLLNKEYFHSYSMKSLQFFLKLQRCTLDNQFVRDMIRSAELIGRLIVAYAESRFLTRPAQYAVYSRITTRAKFEVALEHYKYIDALTRISLKEYKKDEQLVDKSIHLAATISENMSSDVYQYLYTKSNWEKLMRSNYNVSKNDLTSQYSFNPLTPKKLTVKSEITQTKKPMKTVRGRINNPDKQYYSQSNYSFNFSRDMKNTMDQQSQSESFEFDEQEVVKLLNVDPVVQQMEQDMTKDKKLKEHLEEQVQKYKLEVYKQYCLKNKPE